jgi:hypothetical protein
MKALNKVLRIALAATLTLSQGVWLAPALASSGSKHQTVMVIDAEELKSEYGAGGGGGTDPGNPPPTCPSVAGEISTRGICIKPPPPKPNCSYNLDNDYACDSDFEQVGIEHAPASGEAAYENFLSAISLSCIPGAESSDGKCHYNLALQFGVSATFVLPGVSFSAPWGRVGLENIEVGALTTLGNVFTSSPT